MSDIQYKQVHTTIPEKYFKYAKDNRLPWNELLINAIEQKMQSDPEIIQERIENNNRERLQLEQKLTRAKQQDTLKKTKLQDLHKGLVPVD
ncbi:MAG: hypothetical protein MUO82_07750 [Candidatus Thermoplasmatota archaeon]|nr:hypothetical protein [Candidatus Thermoplasmatota archaeon]